MIGIQRSTLERIDRELTAEMGRLAEDAKHRFIRGIGVGEVRTKRGGNATHAFDLELEEALFRFFERWAIPARFSSEERPDIDLSTDPQLLVLIDPLDGSDVAARGYPMCSISVSIVDMETKTPLLSRIVEVFTGLQYAARDGAATVNGAPIRPSAVTAAKDAFVVSYFASRSRLAAFRDSANWDSFKLVLNYGGMLDIAKVGSGQCDAMVEVLKGMVAREYVPGIHIAETAGAVATTLTGDPVPVLLNRDARSRFVVAGTRALHTELLDLFV
jgi:fructose-1,6-bisphosphatase/inositol monophosphatase family enzyme